VKRSFDIIFSLVVFALYVVAALILVMIGGRVYQNASANMSTHYDQRTSVFYIAQRLRQSDDAGQIRVEQLDGQDALVLTEVVGGQVYETWIYVQSGQLYEQLLAPGAQPSAAMGQAIMPMQALTVDGSQLNHGLLTVRFTLQNGSTTSIDLYLRSAGSSGAARLAPGSLA